MPINNALSSAIQQPFYSILPPLIAFFVVFLLFKFLSNMFLSSLSAFVGNLFKRKKKPEILERNHQDKEVSVSLPSRVSKSNNKYKELDFRNAPGKDLCKPKSLLTKPEKDFFKILTGAFEKDFHILTKIRLWDIIERKGDLSEKDEPFFNNLKYWHVDFALCRKNDLFLVCLIELDDNSHEREDQVWRDMFFNDVLRGAGFCLVRIPFSSDYILGEIKGKIYSSVVNHKSICPFCRGVIDKKKAKKGGSDLKDYWVCRNYKTCGFHLEIRDYH